MPQAMTFDSLQTDIRDHIERGQADFDTTVYEQIPVCINNIEREMARLLKIQGFIRVLTSAFVIGQPAYQKPDRWRETISMNVGTGTNNNTRKPLRELAYEAATLYWPDRSSRGEPRFYSDWTYNNWLITPVPDAAYPYEAVIWELPPLLDDNNTTNWLTNEAPNALLHGCLREVYALLKNLELASYWGAQFDKDTGMLAGEDFQKIIDRYYKRMNG